MVGEVDQHRGQHYGRKQVVAVIGIHYFCTEQMVLRQAAGDGVAIGGAFAVYIYVRLDCQPLTGLILIFEVFTDFHNCQGSFVS